MKNQNTTSEFINNRNGRVNCSSHISTDSYASKYLKRQNAEDFKNAESPFYATRTMFREYIGYTEPLSYDQWSSMPDDSKAAALFVQFFEQITLAWYKSRSYYTLEEDAVSTVCQYLIKNVPVIQQDAKRFTPSYIYRVAYNCMYCICHDYKCDRERYENEVSNITLSGDDELDLFDTVISDSEIDAILAKEEFWKKIEDMGTDAVEFVEKLINSGSLPKRLGAERKQLVEALRVELSVYLDPSML